MNALGTRQNFIIDIANDIACDIDNKIIQWSRHAIPRVVLDTSVLVAGVRSAIGASRILLRAALQGRYRPLASTSLLLEYEASLLRAEHLGLAQLTPRDAIILLDAYAASAEYVHIDFSLRSAVDDPNDDMVLEAGVNGGATMIVTLDRAIQRASAFGIAIHSPKNAVHRLRLGR